MKLLGKGLFYASIVVVAVAFLGLLGLNLYLRSPGIREKVESAFERRLGAGVSYDSVSYLPWRGLKVSGLEMAHVPAVAALTKEPFFRVESLVVKVEAWSLVNRPIQVGEILLVEPVVTTIQVTNGSVALPWVPLPRPPMVAMASDGTGVPQQPPAQGPVIAKAPVQAPPSVPALPPAEPTESTATAPVLPVAVSKIPAVILGDVVVEKGAVRVLGPSGKRALLALNGIETRLDVEMLEREGEGQAEGPLGKVTVDWGEVGEILRATELESEILRREDGAFALTAIQGKSDGGSVEGELVVDPFKSGVPFRVRLVGKGMALPQMASRATERMMFSRGSLEAHVEAAGFVKLSNSWRGKGEAMLKEAALAKNGLLESLGRYIGVREFVELVFEEAKAEFQLKGPMVLLDDLHWKTDNLEFKGLGAVGFNQEVRLAARLYFSQRVAEVLQRIERQLPERVVRRLEQVEGRDDFYRDFVIQGRASDLRANFLGSEGRTFEEMLELIKTSSSNG